MASTRRERRQQAYADWRSRRQVRKSDRATRVETRRADRSARSGLEGKEKRQTRRSQRSTRRTDFSAMKESRGETRRQQRVERKLEFKPEMAREVCSPEGARKRAAFAAVVTNPYWLGAAQYLNTSAKVLWAAPEPTMITKVVAGITDGVGYSMKGAAIAGPSINKIRAELACAMVAELEAAGAIPPDLAPDLRDQASEVIVSQWNEIPASNDPDSVFNAEGANSLVEKNQVEKYIPFVVAGMLALYFLRR